MPAGCASQMEGQFGHWQLCLPSCLMGSAGATLGLEVVVKELGLWDESLSMANGIGFTEALGKTLVDASGWAVVLRALTELSFIYLPCFAMLGA